MKMILPALLVAAAALAGCMSNEDPYYRIKVVTASDVGACKYVGNLTSSSNNYGLFDGTAREARLKNAKRSAYNLNATHIVLDPSIENGNTTITDGKAYICPR